MMLLRRSDNPSAFEPRAFADQVHDTAAGNRAQRTTRRQLHALGDFAPPIHHVIQQAALRRR